MDPNFQNMFFSENVDLNENLFEREEHFVNSSREWMRHYVPSSMKSLSITFSKPEKFNIDIENHVNFSVDREVKSLTLDFSNPSWKESDQDDAFDFHPPTFSLPLHVYGHATNIESLTLFCCNFSASNLRSFTALKHLSLGYMRLESLTIEAVLPTCPSLQSIHLKRCLLDSFCDVTLPQVNRLILDDCIFDYKTFRVEAPMLKYLMYKGHVCYFGLEIDKYLFTEAVLDFTSECQYQFYDGDGVHLQTLLRDLFSVTTLTVCSFFLQLLPHGEEPVKLIDLNVRTLKLNTALHHNELEGIGFLFNNCPELKTLIMDVYPPRGRILPDYEAPFKHIGFVGFKCVRTKLEQVEMNGFTGELYQLPMLKSLLNVGLALEKLTVRVSREGDSDLYARRAQEFLPLFQKASKSVQIVIC